MSFLTSLTFEKYAVNIVSWSVAFKTLQSSQACSHAFMLHTKRPELKLKKKKSGGEYSGMWSGIIVNRREQQQPT